MIVGNQLNMIRNAVDALRCAPIGTPGWNKSLEHLLELAGELHMDRHKQSGPRPGDGWDWWAVGDNMAILRRVG